MPERGTKEMYDARMKAGERPEVKAEFDEWIADMRYEALLASPAMKNYLWEAFVGGWGSKVRQVKRRRRMKAKGEG